MRFTLLFSVFCLCASLKAQTGENLKDFINKNDVAIKSVHKNMIAQNLTAYVATFKDLIKKQEAAVKAYSLNKENSAALALAVRKECLNFLKKNYKGSTEFYEITNEEQKFASGNSKTDTSILTSDEIKAIENLDVMNFQSISTLPLTIQ